MNVFTAVAERCEDKKAVVRLAGSFEWRALDPPTGVRISPGLPLHMHEFIPTPNFLERNKY